PRSSARSRRPPSSRRRGGTSPAESSARSWSRSRCSTAWSSSRRRNPPRSWASRSFAPRSTSSRRWTSRTSTSAGRRAPRCCWCRVRSTRCPWCSLRCRPKPPMSSERADRRRAPTHHECERLRSALDPTARSLTAVPLLGGVDRSTYALTLDRDGGPKDLVLRTAGTGKDAGARIRHEFDILGAVSAVTDLAPAPVLVDARGDLVGEPSLVMTRLAGAPEPPRDPDAWVAQLVDTLVTIHAIPTDRLPPSFDRRLGVV